MTCDYLPKMDNLIISIIIISIDVEDDQKTKSILDMLWNPIIVTVLQKFSLLPNIAPTIVFQIRQEPIPDNPCASHQCVIGINCYK